MKNKRFQFKFGDKVRIVGDHFHEGMTGRVVSYIAQANGDVMKYNLRTFDIGEISVLPQNLEKVKKRTWLF